MKALMNGITVANPGSFSYADEWFSVSSTTTLDEPLAIAINAIRPYYAKHQYKGEVTSGYRSAEHQLSLIIGFLGSHGLGTEFANVISDFDKGRNINQTIVYWWQLAWSRLLDDKVGLIVNPPIAGLCLCHSHRPDGSDRFGMEIPETPHSHGTAFDQDSGRNMNDELAIMQEAMKDPACRIRNLTIERMQGCLHADIDVSGYELFL
jgi:hypothetical protein